MSDCSQPSRVSGVSRVRGRYSSVAASAGRLRCSSRRSRPRVASSGWPTSRWLVSSRAAPSPCSAGKRLPQLVAGVRQPQVQIVMVGQRARAVRCRCTPAGCGRTARAGRAARWPPPAAGQWFSRAGCAGDRQGRCGHQRAPQLRLPVQVGVEVAPCCRPASRPAAAGAAGRRRRTARPAGGPPRIGDRGAARLSAPMSKWPRCVASVAHHGSSKRAVDDLQQRPRHRLGRPGIVVDRPGDLGDQRRAGCGTPRRRTRRHHRCGRAPARAKAAGSASAPRRGPAPAPVPRANGSGSGFGQQRAEPVGKQVGPLGTVKVKRHRASP